MAGKMIFNFPGNCPVYNYGDKPQRCNSTSTILSGYVPLVPLSPGSEPIPSQISGAWHAVFCFSFLCTSLSPWRIDAPLRCNTKATLKRFCTPGLCGARLSEGSSHWNPPSAFWDLNSNQHNFLNFPFPKPGFTMVRSQSVCTWVLSNFLMIVIVESFQGV